MFDHLPLEIRQIIFSRVRYMDLFETARVSQGWWTVTMASFERFHHKKDDFLLDQVDFCNEMMSKEEPWEWWMLMEFTKSKRLYLENSDFQALVSDGKGRLIQYFSSMEIRVKHLRVESLPNAVLELPPNFHEIFPCLTSLEVDGFAQTNNSTIVLPLNLVSLRFGARRVRQFRFSIGLATSELKVLDLKGCGLGSFFLLNALKFDKLTRLSLTAYGLPPSSSTRIEQILKKICDESKTLKSVKFDYAYITKEWLKIFPSNVAKIALLRPRLNQDLVKAFGKNVFYERLLLMYICEGWKSVVEFKTCWMSWEKYQEEVVHNEEENDDVAMNNADNDGERNDAGNDEEMNPGGNVEINEGNNEERNEDGNDNGIENAYQVQYLCLPTANKEGVVVKYSKVAINELISKNNQGLLLTTLVYFNHSYTFPIPANVRSLRFLKDWNHPNDDNFELVLQDPTALRVLKASHMGRMATLPSMINLRELNLPNCSSSLLVSILRSCTSLSKLTLWWPESTVFENVVSNIKSVSIKDLTIIGGSDTFENILAHFPSLKLLTLEKHSRESILKSDVSAIKRLRYFKVIMEGSKELAVHMSTLQFPYMLFAYYRSSHYYAASKRLKLVNEISRSTSRNNMVKAGRTFVLQTQCCSVSHEEGSLVFSKNIPARFLRNTYQVVSTVQDFIDKL